MMNEKKMSHGDTKEEPLTFEEGLSGWLGCLLALFFGLCFIVWVASIVVAPRVYTIEYEFVTVDDVYPQVENGKLVYYFDVKEPSLNVWREKAWNNTLNKTFEVREGMQLTLKWEIGNKWLTRSSVLIDCRIGWVDPVF